MNNYAIYETVIGKVIIGYEGNKLTKLNKADDDISKEGVKTDFTDKVYRQLIEYFEGKRKTFDIELSLEGTDFQRKVWVALQRIPYGETRSYKDIAIMIESPKASRAVGMANNKNPIGIIVPCHRVIGSSGKLVGYAYGLDMKKQLLELEKNK